VSLRTGHGRSWTLMLVGGCVCVLAAAVCARAFTAPRLEAVALRPDQMEGFTLLDQGATTWECGTLERPASARAAFQEWKHTASDATFTVTWAVFRSPKDAEAAGRTGSSWTEARLEPGTYSGVALGDASWYFAAAPQGGSGSVAFSSGRFVGTVRAHGGRGPSDVALLESVAKKLLENMTGR